MVRSFLPVDVVLLSGPYALGGFHGRIVLPVDVVLLSGPHALGGFHGRIRLWAGPFLIAQWLLEPTP